MRRLLLNVVFLKQKPNTDSRAKTPPMDIKMDNKNRGDKEVVFR